MKRRRWLWLVAAAALLALGAFFMRDPAPKRAALRHPPEEFPRKMREPEQRRIARRRVAMASPDAGPAHLRDPMLAALPPGGGADRTALVFEAEAMKAMPVGRMFLRCMQQSGRADRMEAQLGVSPDDVERVAVSNDVTILGGDFGDVPWGNLFGDARGGAYGSHANVYENPNAEGAGSAFVANYGDGFVLFGKTRAEVEAAIDRMDGNAAETTPAIPDDEAYGEVYGQVGVDAIARILDREQPELADRLRDAAGHIDLHVDATGDVLLVSDVTGTDGQTVGDLGKAFGGALAVGRMTAKSDEDSNLADLLEGARVRPRGDSFGVEVALPIDVIERALGPCAKEPDGGKP